jgi:hypothetical protein
LEKIFSAKVREVKAGKNFLAKVRLGFRLFRRKRRKSPSRLGFRLKVEKRRKKAKKGQKKAENEA